MNIFKKIKDSLLDKVESRVIQEVKLRLPILLKHHHRSFFVHLLTAGLVSSVSYFLMTFIKFKYQADYQLLNAIAIYIIFVFFLVAFVGGLVSSFVLLIDYLMGLWNLKKAQFMDNVNSSIYKKIIHVNSEMLLPIQELTKEEFIELLSMSLNPNQIQFLRHKIMLYKKFTLEDLVELEGISFDVTEENKKKEALQHDFNEFLSQYDLTEHAYLTVDELPEQETTLSSKL